MMIFLRTLFTDEVDAILERQLCAGSDSHRADSIVEAFGFHGEK